MYLNSTYQSYIEKYSQGSAGLSHACGKSLHKFTELAQCLIYIRSLYSTRFMSGCVSDTSYPVQARRYAGVLDFEGTPIELSLGFRLRSQQVVLPYVHSALVEVLPNEAGKLVVIEPLIVDLLEFSTADVTNVLSSCQQYLVKDCFPSRSLQFIWHF
jgi:hypothetical protein